MASEAPNRLLPSGRRLLLILLGYVAACLVAAIVLGLSLIGHDVLALGLAKALQAVKPADTLVVIGAFFVLGVVFAAPFAALAISLSENLGMHGVVALALAGGFVGVGVKLLAHLAPLKSFGSSTLDVSTASLFAAAGIVGGFVYALVAAPRRQRRRPGPPRR